MTKYTRSIFIVIIMLLLKYSVEILVGNKKVGKNFGR